MNLDLSREGLKIDVRADLDETGQRLVTISAGFIDTPFTDAQASTLADYIGDAASVSFTLDEANRLLVMLQSVVFTHASQLADEDIAAGRGVFIPSMMVAADMARGLVELNFNVEGRTFTHPVLPETAGRIGDMLNQAALMLTDRPEVVN